MFFFSVLKTYTEIVYLCSGFLISFRRRSRIITPCSTCLVLNSIILFLNIPIGKSSVPSQAAPLSPEGDGEPERTLRVSHNHNRNHLRALTETVVIIVLLQDLLVKSCTSGVTRNRAERLLRTRSHVDANSDSVSASDRTLRKNALLMQRFLVSLINALVVPEKDVIISY